MSPSGNILNFPDRSPIEEEAARWVVRHGEGNLSAGERAQFDAWKQASPAHVEAFARLSGHWQDLNTLEAFADTPVEKPLLKRPTSGPAPASRLRWCSLLSWAWASSVDPLRPQRRWLRSRAWMSTRQR